MQETITLQNRTVTLQGTLTTPDSAGPHPVVIAAHTSNAGTRDFHVYRHLAKILPLCDVAVFLFDRRGSGCSTGNFETATFFDLASDLRTAIDHLKVRSDIDSKHIGLWGMSQGGWIAPLAAVNSTDAEYVVAVSSVGETPAEQMDYCARFELEKQGFSQETIGQMLELRNLVYAYYRGELEQFEVQEKLNLFRHEAWFSLAYLDDHLPEDPRATKWYREMDYDPIPVMKNLGYRIWQRRIIALTADGRSVGLKSAQQALSSPARWLDLSQIARISSSWKAETPLAMRSPRASSLSRVRRVERLFENRTDRPEFLGDAGSHGRRTQDAASWETRNR